MTTTTTGRSDLHRPSAIQPENYRYMESWDLEMPLMPIDRDIRVLMDRAEASSADHSGNLAQCDHCGAHLRYICLWEHVPSGDVITTGETCARETMDVPNRLLLDQKRLRETAAARRVALRERAEVTERQERARELYPQAYAILFDYQGDNSFVADVAARFGRNGYLSEKQAIAVVNSVAKQTMHAERRRIEAATATTCPEGRIKVTGKVVSTGTKENAYGVRHVMTVRDDRGFKVWGTVPSGLVVPVLDIEGNRVGIRGLDQDDRVEFVGAVTRSDRDETFGFYKRPSCAKVI